MTYKTIIIDDSSVHRMAISFLVKNHPKLKLVGSYSDPLKGVESIFDHQADFVFLDVLLENIDAFQLLDTIELPSTIILNSSWSKFSSRAKQYGIQDFLLKPVRKADFEATINKAISRLESIEEKNQLTLKPYLLKNPNVFQAQKK